MDAVPGLRWRTKEVLGRLPDRGPARGATLLIWHRVGGGTGDELDVPRDAFARQLDLLDGHDVVSLDEALDRLAAGDERPCVVLTFDDGFADVHRHAHPLLAERRLPYTLYLATAFVGRPMRWEGATATGTADALGLSWEELGELVASGLCTVGNHTHDHVPPERLDAAQLDRCSDAVEEHLGSRPAHFAFPWGVPVPALRPALAERFRSAATGTRRRSSPPSSGVGWCRSGATPASWPPPSASAPVGEPRWRPVRPDGTRRRLAHLTTSDISLSLLLATELRADVEAGFEVLGISAPSDYVADVEALGVRHVAVPELTRRWDLGADLRAARALARRLRELDLDVLHTHNPKTGVLGRILGRLARIPVVVNTCHGLWAASDDPLVRRAFVVGSEAIAARFSDYELFQNAEDRRRLRFAVSATRSRVVGNGIDLARFRFDPAGRRRVRAELGVGDDEVLVGGVGRRVAEKGIIELAAAARVLSGKAAFVWVGPDDPAKPDAVGDGDDGAGDVRFLGERRDMVAVYSALDVFALPSYREGFSRSAMEAAACGRAMVLSDIRGCREIGTHDEHVLFVPAGDADALAAAIERLVADPGLRRRLGAAAGERARQAFDQRRVAATSIAVYRLVAERKGLRW
jgi:glycosyltransferase involved in cell wall biosynthesis